MLEASGISKQFGGLRALKDASLAVEQGRITALVGPNGAGKTTLFAVISGFIKPNSGSIRFDGADITPLKPHSIGQLGIARTFQIVQPFAGLTVRENVAVGAHLRTASRSRALELAEAVAIQVGMGDFLDSSAGELTIAGRKRLEVAKALATQPKLLLLDEVMAGLVPSEVNDMVATLRTIRDTGVTILLIEHVMQAVMSLSDDVYVLNNGAMIAHGTPQEIASDSRVIEAYLGHGAAERLRTRTPGEAGAAHA